MNEKIEAGSIIFVNGCNYKAHSFNILANTKRTGTTDPCTLCDLDNLKDMQLCNKIECITGTDFLYLKKI